MTVTTLGTHPGLAGTVPTTWEGLSLRHGYEMTSRNRSGSGYLMNFPLDSASCQKYRLF